MAMSRANTPAFILSFLLAFVLGTFLPAACAQPADDQPMVRVAAVAERTQTAPGDTFAVAVRFAFKEHFHIWPNSPVKPKGLDDLEPIPTLITLAPMPPLPAGVRVFTQQAQWPKPDEITVAFGPTPMSITSYARPFVAFVPVQIAGDAKPGEITIPLTVSYQACNESNCFAPEEVALTVTLTIAPPGTKTTDAEPTLFMALDRPAMLAALQAASVSTPPTPTVAIAPSTGVVNFGAFGINLNIDTRGILGLVLVLIVAFLGGVLLNFVPCVLPVIPIKLIGLQQSAGKSRAKMFFFGVVTAAGVVAFWVAGGLLIALAVVGALSQLVSFWWFNMAISVLIIAMGLGMFGLFQAGLPQWVYRISPSHGTLWGSFLFGILHAVLSIPCIAPLGGAAMAWAATQSPGVTIAVFAGIGLGMSTPYLLLSAFPNSIAWIPRAGPASELLKQVMGLLMIAGGVFFLGTAIISLVAMYPYLAKVLHWWVIAGVVAGAGLWMGVRIFFVAKSRITKGVIAGIGLLMGISAIWWANAQTASGRIAYEQAQAEQTMSTTAGLWQAYSAEAFDRAVAEGKVVVLDFTAEWCLNCKILEATVLSRDDVRAAINAPGVVSFKADLTARNAPGWARLKAFNRNGIPLLVIQGPGLPQPWLSEAYTPTQVIETIANARGK